jgi:hypothetical protein
MLRDSTSCTNMSAVSTPTPITRANRRTIACAFRGIVSTDFTAS